MLRRLIQLALACLGSSILTLAATPSVGAPLTLLSEVELKPKLIKLSDLLPADASASLREASARIPLGSAPAPGNVRDLKRAEIEQALVEKPEILAQIRIPEKIAVRRAYRQITSAAIAAALNSALKGEHPIDPAGLGLQVSASAYFTGDDPGLVVTGIDFDALHHATRVRLWTSKEPENLPFCVTVPGRFRSLVQAVASPAADMKAAQPRAASAPAAPAPGSGGQSVKLPGKAKPAEVLVNAGVETKLVIQGSDYRLTATVIPLQPGVLGQQIQVRDPLTHKLWSAQVAGRGLLIATL